MELATLAYLSLGATAVGTVGSIAQQQAGRRNNERAAYEQKKISAEQSASNAEQFSRERRQQIREERIRRSQILTSAANNGGADSSGEMGAVGGMSTNLFANLGTNQASAIRGQTITGFAQESANYTTKAQNNQARAGMWGNVSQLGTQMFAATGGFQAFKKPPTG